MLNVNTILAPEETNINSPASEFLKVREKVLQEMAKERNSGAFWDAYEDDKAEGY